MRIEATDLRAQMGFMYYLFMEATIMKRVIEYVCGDCIYHLSGIFPQCLQLQSDEKQELIVGEMYYTHKR